MTMSFVFFSEDAVSTETLNGHAVSSGGTEEVKVDIESPETPAEEKSVITPEADDTEGDIFLDCLHICVCNFVLVFLPVCLFAVLPSHVQQRSSNWQPGTASRLELFIYFRFNPNFSECQI